MIEIERRRSERWVAKPGVLLEYRPTRRLPLIKGRYRLFGVVMDLSTGGLSVEYADRKLRPLEKVEYALSIPKAGLRLEGLQMHAVSDFVLVDETGCGGEVCRRRGFQFGKMSRDQQEILHRILRNCTSEPLGS